VSLENYLLIAHADTILSALLVLVAFYRYNKKQDEVRLIGFLVLGSFLCNLSSYLLARFKTGLVNIPPSLYEFILISIVCALFNKKTNGQYRTWFIFIVIVYFILASLNLLFWQKESITSYNKVLSSLIIICLSLFYFYRSMVEPSGGNPFKIPMFWFNSSFLIYHSGTIFLFAFTTYLIQVLKNDLIVFMSFHNFLMIVQHLMILTGLCIDLRFNHSPRFTNG
jgi:hypothetical protein